MAQVKYFLFDDTALNEVSHVQKNGTDTGLAARLNLTVEQFPSESGLKLKQMFTSWEKELNLTDIIGHSKFYYNRRFVTSKPDSLQRLWS